jgi:hypothetical protein
MRHPERETEVAVKPNGLFKVWSADEVAECLNVGEALYVKLWNEIVPLYANKPRSEVPDDFSSRNLSKFWSKFSDEEKKALNEAAKKHDAELAALADGGRRSEFLKKS